MTIRSIRIGSIACNTDRPERLASSAWTLIPAVTSRARWMLAEYIRQRAFRRAEKELMNLDDRMLRDIGLHRSEIGSAVRNPEQERLVSLEGV
jgi:uncharacterized protein YjiS (DUF1127 family)